MRAVVVLAWMLCCIGVACKTSTPGDASTPVPPTTPTATNSTTNTGLSQEQVLQLLVISDLTLTTTTLQGNQWPHLTFERSAQSEYIRYDACLDSNPTKCIQGDLISALDFTITGLSPGMNTIKIYACIRKDAVDATANDNCGAAASAIFLQTEMVSQELDDAVTKRNAVEQQILAAGQTLYDAIFLFKNNRDACSDTKIQAFLSVAVMDKYLALGPHFIGVGLEDPTAQILSSTGSDGQVVFTIQSQTTTLSSTSSTSSSGSASDGGSSSPSSLDEGLGITTLVTIGLFGLHAFGHNKLLSTMATEKVKENVQEAKTTASGKTGSVAGSALVIGLIVLTVLLSPGNDPLNDFALTAETTTASPCSACEEAVQSIEDVNTQTTALRSQLQQLNQTVKTLTQKPS